MTKPASFPVGGSLGPSGGWDREVDLLVAGAGPAGMTAALVAALEGLNVLVCEKAGQIGGTASTSAGTLWVPGNNLNKLGSSAQSVAQARLYLTNFIGEEINPQMRDAFLDTARLAVDYLHQKTDVKFLPCGFLPDYRCEIPGAWTTGHSVIAAPFDGRLLGRDFELVRPPIEEFMVFGGMSVGKVDIVRLLNRFKSVRDFAYAGGLFLRYLVDRLSYSRGTRVVMGNALVARLFYSLRKHDVPVLLNAPIHRLLCEAGAVIGAEIESNGQLLRVRARRGVVLATGGVGHHQALRKTYMPQPMPESMACDTVAGDGIEIGRNAGASFEGEGHSGIGFWTPVSHTRRRNGDIGLFPHLALDRAKPGLIAVNSAGERFVNEGASYHDFVEAMYRSHRLVPTIPAYLICDADFVAAYGLGVIHPETTDLRPHEAGGYIVTGRSIAELAGKIGVDAKTLERTIERHNGFAESGVDLDFGKGDTEHSRFNGDANHSPNPCLKSIRRAPFVALAVWPAEIGCSAGLLTDTDARVLNDRGEPIFGLYTCGNDMASLMRGTYPGPGTTLGPAIVFGYRAAMHAARQTNA